MWSYSSWHITCACDPHSGSPSRPCFLLSIYLIQTLIKSSPVGPRSKELVRKQEGRGVQNLWAAPFCCLKHSLRSVFPRNYSRRRNSWRAHFKKAVEHDPCLWSTTEEAERKKWPPRSLPKINLPLIPSSAWNSWSRPKRGIQKLLRCRLLPVRRRKFFFFLSELSCLPLLVLALVYLLHMKPWHDIYLRASGRKWKFCERWPLAHSVPLPSRLSPHRHHICLQNV